MRCRNAHTAGIDDIAPGAVGEVDATSAPVQKLIAAGLLVPLDGEALQDLRAERPPTIEEGLEMVREIHSRGHRVTELEAELAASRDELSIMSIARDALNDTLAAARAELATATAALTAARAELAAKTPASDDKPPKTRREG